jgi:hypothetical protein
VDAVLSAIAALAKENPTHANMPVKPSLERDREFLLSFVVDIFFSYELCFLYIKTQFYSLLRHATRTPCTGLHSWI